MTAPRDEVLLTGLFSAASTLTALLIHIVHILHWDVMFENNLEKKVDVVQQLGD
jgi:hypothetical protein